MSGRRRMMRLNKKEFDVLEWIETDKNCFIPTDIYINNLDYFEYKFLKNDTLKTFNAGLYSIREGSAYNTGAFYSFTYGNIGSTYTFHVYNTDKAYTDAYNYAYSFGYIDDKKIHTVKYNEYVLYFDGQVISTRGNVKITTGYTYKVPFVLFGGIRLNNEIIIANSSFRLYYANFGEHRFVCVRKKSNGAVGVYDTAFKKFYENKGTGTFLTGDIIGEI